MPSAMRSIDHSHADRQIRVNRAARQVRGWPIRRHDLDGRHAEGNGLRRVSSIIFLCACSSGIIVSAAGDVFGVFMGEAVAPAEAHFVPQGLLLAPKGSWTQSNGMR